jgi:hypothetical protein
LEHEREDTSCGHGTNESHCAEEDGAEIVGWEEFMVEEEDGDFDDPKTERV